MSLSAVFSPQQLVNDPPHCGGTVATETAAFAVLDDVVEIELLLFLCACLRRQLRLLFLLLRGIELGDRLVKQRVAVGDLIRRSRQDVAGDGDVALAAAIGFDHHAVGVRHRLAPVQLRPVARRMMRKPVSLGVISV